MGTFPQDRLRLGSFRKEARSWVRFHKTARGWVRFVKRPAVGFVRQLVKSRTNAKIQPNINICLMLCLNDKVIEFGFVRRIFTRENVLPPAHPPAVGFVS